MKTYPIQFAFPNAKLPNFTNIEKTSLFSDMSPLGMAKKYKFYIEEEYYAHYSKSYFAITTKKGGWDCLRHYEILASGTLPYFVGIEKCPTNTLFQWPKELLREVKNIKGMPSEKQVLRATKKGKFHSLKKTSEFDEMSYWRLHKEMMRYFKDHLIGSRLAEYFLEKNDLTEKEVKILFTFGIKDSCIDYQRDLLLSALASHPNIELTVYPHPFWHLKTCHRIILNTLYGRGFTCTATLNQEQLGKPDSWNNIKKNLDKQDLIVSCTSSNHGVEALPPEVQESFKHRDDIIWVDGNDIKGYHEIPNFAKRVFRREMV